ncbi:MULTISPECIES: type II toxin-antitoxin system VapB family antitoxin [unclassified Nocardiopsis]|uniref:type II toxin-antitoxin system VapB family antitoxin n=1 Tax=Nocardiopsis TaxID=2013 RepID=UPI00387B0754
MSPTRIDIDDEVLREAMRLSGADTEDEVVDPALREYTARHRRTTRHHRTADLEHFAALARDWDHEGWQRTRGKG